MRLACLFALLALAWWRSSVGASDNPLTPTDIGAPGCQTAPLQEADLLQLTATNGRWIPTELPQGGPAPAHVQEEIATTVQEVFECVMTGDPARSLANYSHDYLAEHLSAAMSDLSQPVEARDQTVDVSGLYQGPWRVIMLPDRRVAALLLSGLKDDPHPDPGNVAIWLFVREDGRWRVDDVIDMIVPPGQERPVYIADLVDGPPAATPSPEP
jgi:hypothetical protein